MYRTGLEFRLLLAQSSLKMPHYLQFARHIPLPYSPNIAALSTMASLSKFRTLEMAQAYIVQQNHAQLHCIFKPTRLNTIMMTEILLAC